MARTLEAYRHQHDLVRVRERPAKAQFAMEALDRHPRNVVVMLDPGCQVHAPLHGLRRVTGDVALYVQHKRHASGRIRFAPRSSTVVLRPTRRTRRFLALWDQLTKAPSRSLAQSPLAVALAQAEDLTVEQLHPSYCVIPADQIAFAHIMHTGPLHRIRPATWWRRALHRLIHL